VKVKTVKRAAWVMVYLLVAAGPASIAYSFVLYAANPVIYTVEHFPVQSGYFEFSNGTVTYIGSPGVMTCTWAGCTFSATMRMSSS